MAYTTINDPSAYFYTQLYTGSSSGQSITNDASSGDFKPDWVWIKRRDGDPNVVGNGHHSLYDSSRGVQKEIYSDLNSAEATNSNALTAFGTDGFTVGTEPRVNSNGLSFVSWQWKANGGTTSTNTDGSENSTVQVNSTAGFSIVKRTGTGSAGATYGHGLGAVPDVIINKGLNTNEWYSYFKAIGGGTHWIALESTGGAVADANMWNNTDATSSVFTVGNSGGSNGNGVEYINYCFKEIQGYSKFGSYVGNGSEPDGPFIYTGFKPAWFMVKASSEAGQAWFIGDSKRDPYNVAVAKLTANTSSVESDTVGDNNWDFLSNGFKIKTLDDGMNKSGVTFIYMAFAENPLVASNNVIALAR